MTFPAILNDDAPTVVKPLLKVTPDPIVKSPSTWQTDVPVAALNTYEPDVLSKRRLPYILPDSVTAGVRVELPRKIIVLAGSKVATPMGVEALEVVL